MEKAKPCSHAYVAETGVEKYHSFRTKWILYCIAEIKHLFVFFVVGLRWRKKSRVDAIYASSCVEEKCGSAHGCSVNTIAVAELVCCFGTYCNVWRFDSKLKLFAVAYRQRGCIYWCQQLCGDGIEGKSVSPLPTIWILVIGKLFVISLVAVASDKWVQRAGAAEQFMVEWRLCSIWYLTGFRCLLVFRHRWGVTGGLNNFGVLAQRRRRMSRNVETPDATVARALVEVYWSRQIVSVVSDVFFADGCYWWLLSW